MQPDAKGLESGFQTAKQKQVGAIMITAGRRFGAERKRIVELAVNTACPLFTPIRSSWKLVASCHMGRTSLTSFGAQLFTWTRF